MHSLTKTQISFEIAQQILGCHFGSKSKLSGFRELTDGFFNSAYFLELSDGMRLVMKIAPQPNIKVLRYEKSIMKTEVNVMRLIKTSTEIPVPAIHAHDFTHDLLECDYFIMDFVDGIPLNKIRETLSEVDSQAIDERTGEFLRQMNLIGGEKFGYFSQTECTSNSWREAYDLLLANVLEDGQDVGVLFPLDHTQLHSLLRPHFPALDEVKVPQLVHWDLWDGNIFIHPDTKQITGLIDFERALWADPLMEANFGAFGINPSFLKGYGKNLPLTINEQKRRSLYNIYLYLIMVIECYYRKYDTDQQENWARDKLMGELEIIRRID